MIMEKIDLTKCNNCRAWVRYRYDRVYEGTGRIEKVTEGGGEAWMRFVADEDGELITMWEDGKICEHIMDFEIIPRDPETYMDWQEGDKATDPNEKWNDSAYKEIIFRSGELVICKDGNGDISGGYTCGQLHRLGYRLVLTDIEKKKAEWEPRDGDVCYAENRDGYCTTFIYRHTGLNRTAFYAAFDNRGDVLIYHGNAISKETLKLLRPATEEERQRLFDAMAKQGKRWNAEKKVVEDIP